MYKICQVLLILHMASRGGRSRLPRLHLFNWALKTSARSQQLVGAAQAKSLRVAAWGFDPALAIALRYAVAEGVVNEVSAGYELSDSGVALAKDVANDSELLVAEKKVLLAIGRSGITEGMVDEVAKGWEAA
jgi:enoyl-CoA hydratase/carnithine racemase